MNSGFDGIEQEFAQASRWRRGRRKREGPPPGSFAFALAKQKLCEECGDPVDQQRELCILCELGFEEKLFQEVEGVMAKKETKKEETKSTVPSEEKGGTIRRVNPMELVIASDPKHPLYDPRATEELPEWMIVSIAEVGVKVPIICRKNGDALEVVDGRQRVRAAVEANIRRGQKGMPLLRVPVMVQDIDDKQAAGFIVMLNEIRKADSAYNKAEKAKSLKDRYDMTDAEIAPIFGVSEQAVHGWIAVMNTAPEVVQAIKDRKLRISAAKELLSLSREEQADIVKTLMAKEPPIPNSQELREEGDTESDETSDDERTHREHAASGDGEGLTGRDIRNEKNRRKAAKEGRDEPNPRPSSVMINRMIKYAEDSEHKFSKILADNPELKTAFAVIRWLRGEGSALKVPGLAKLYNATVKLHAPRDPELEE